MMRLLVLGDSHIPKRAKEVPDPILEEIDNLTKDSLFDHILFTGDLIESPTFIDFLNSKTEEEVLRVLGNMDYYGGNRNAPKMEYLEIPFATGEELRIGLTHGAQIKDRGNHSQLEQLALERDSHILVSGHTHKEEIYLTKEAVLLLNPGSVTGAWSFLATETPAFIQVLIYKENPIEVILYQLQDNRIQQSRETFKFEKGRIRTIN
ncbi:MAG: YfcE family phosphodiesterase [Promethearchaeia archaeon]